MNVAVIIGLYIEWLQSVHSAMCISNHTCLKYARIHFRALKRSRSLLTKNYWWILITYVITQYSVIVIAPILYHLTPLSKSYANIYGGIISFIIGLIVVLIILLPEMKAKPKPGAATGGQVVLWSFLGIFMAFIGQIIAANIEIYILGIETSSENTENIMEITKVVPLFTVITVIIAPILEEIIFRKIIFGTLYKHMNFFLAGIISAVIFGLVHMDALHLLIYTSMGLVFAFLYVKTKRIIVPIIAHAGMNGIAVLIHTFITPELLEKLEKQLEQMHIIFGG